MSKNGLKPENVVTPFRTKETGSKRLAWGSEIRLESVPQLKSLQRALLEMTGLLFPLAANLGSLRSSGTGKLLDVLKNLNLLSQDLVECSFTKTVRALRVELVNIETQLEILERVLESEVKLNQLGIFDFDKKVAEFKTALVTIQIVKNTISEWLDCCQE